MDGFRTSKLLYAPFVGVLWLLLKKNYFRKKQKPHKQEQNTKNNKHKNNNKHKKQQTKAKNTTNKKTKNTHTHTARKGAHESLGHRHWVNQYRLRALCAPPPHLPYQDCGAWRQSVARAHESHGAPPSLPSLARLRRSGTGLRIGVGVG